MTYVLCKMRKNLFLVHASNSYQLVIPVLLYIFLMKNVESWETSNCYESWCI